MAILGQKTLDLMILGKKVKGLALIKIEFDSVDSDTGLDTYLLSLSLSCLGITGTAYLGGCPDLTLEEAHTYLSCYGLDTEALNEIETQITKIIDTFKK